MPMFIELIAVSIRMSPLRRWHGMFMTYRTAVVKVRLRYKLSEIFVHGIMLDKQMTWWRLKKLLKTGSLPFLELMSSRSDSRKKGTCLTPKKEHGKEATWLTGLASRQILFQRKTADKLKNPSVAVTF